MKNATKQYNFMKKDTDSIRYSKWFKEVDFGSPNGSEDIKNLELQVSKIKVAFQNELGEKPLITWSKRFSLSEKNWSLIRLVVLLSLELELKQSIGNSHRRRFVRFLPFLLFLEFSFVMGRLEKLRQKDRVMVSLIHMLKPKRLESSIRQTLLAHDTSEVQNESLDSIRFIRWTLQGIQRLRASFLINRHSLCADIWLKHGDLWEFPGCLRWTMKWLPQEVDAIPLASPRLSAFICSWASIWYLSLKENPEETHRLKVSMNSGRKGYLGDITVPLFLLLEEPVNVFCGIIITRNLIRALSQKEHGTRFPGILRDRNWKHLRHLPKGFTLDTYIDSSGHLNIPIAKGKVSFIRKVDTHGRIEVNGSSYFVRRKLEGQYVVATIIPQRKRLVVKQDKKNIKSFTFPLKGHVITPLLAKTKRKT